MSAVSDLLKEINSGLDQVSSSRKDEVKVMQTMLNDKDYTVGVYGKEGLIGEYSPFYSARDMISTIIASTAKIPKLEAETLAQDHMFSKGEASLMVDLSKEFVNTYLQSGRKLPLGSREKSDVAVAMKEIPPSQRSYPKKVGVDANGNAVYEHPVVEVNGYNSIKVYASCPAHLKNNNDK